MAACATGARAGHFVGIAAGVCLAAATLAVTAAPAEAHGGWRPYRHAAQHHHAHYAARRPAAVATDPAFSAIVVDANSGRELYGVNENAPRHPASITKVMTLYLLFEQLDKGALTLQSQIPISEHAAAQEPSKLGIAAGDSISVEDAIKAVVTRSANDVAVAIAEAIGRDEATFAQMMTHQAHALGMSRTIYRNASGLPNDEQITTARDLTVLARATEERFPKYFRYYSTHDFEYDGEVIGNHNHLLGRIDGVDGIKTGYTRASGFNLLTSVHREGRSLVAVVMGGRTSGARDRMMEALISEHIADASTRGHTATLIADNEMPTAPMPSLAAARTTRFATEMPPASIRSAAEPKGEGDNTAEDDEDSAPRAAPAPISAPSGKTVAVAQPPAKGAAAAPPAAKTVAAAPQPAKIVARVAATPERTAAATPADLGWVKGPDPAPLADMSSPSAKVAAPAARAHQEPHPEEVRAEETRVARADDTRGDGKGGWAIQIGASDDEGKANALLIRARAQNPATLASAKAITEKIRKGEDIFYRARFAGLDSVTAEQACRSLKRSGFACFAARD